MEEFVMISVRLTKAEKDQLAKYAKEQDTSMSKIAKKAILKFLNEQN